MASKSKITGVFWNYAWLIVGAIVHMKTLIRVVDVSSIICNNRDKTYEITVSHMSACRFIICGPEILN